MTTYDPPQVTAPAPATIETVGDGMSTTALITTWVGASVPLLPAVALFVAIAGRKRSLTRWLNTVAIIAAAAFLATQLIVVLAFGGVIATALSNLANRDSDSVASSFVDDPVLDEYNPLVEDDDLEDTPAPAETSADEAPVDDVDMSELSQEAVMPGQDPDLDTVYLDTMGSFMEGSGFSLSDFDEGFLYETAGDTCRAMDDGATLETVAQTINDQDIPRAISGTIAEVAVLTYCPANYI